jgi:hypothetical protein
MKTTSFRSRLVAVLGLAGLISACGGAEPAEPPSPAVLISSGLPRLQLEALCPVTAMSEGPSFAKFESTARELNLSADEGAPFADPRYRSVQRAQWVVNDQAPSGEGGTQGRTTLWIGQLEPGVHDFRFLTIPDREGRDIRGGGSGDQRRFTTAITCVLHLEDATREVSSAMLREYRQNFYDGLSIGAYPPTEAAPAGSFAEWRWVNGNHTDLYVETDLIAPKPGETGVTLVRRYVFW